MARKPKAPEQENASTMPDADILSENQQPEQLEAPNIEAVYFKVIRPKQQGQPEEELDEAEYMEADTTEEDDGPPWDVEDEDTEEGRR